MIPGRPSRPPTSHSNIRMSHKLQKRTVGETAAFDAELILVFWCSILLFRHNASSLIYNVATKIKAITQAWIMLLDTQLFARPQHSYSGRCCRLICVGTWHYHRVNVYTARRQSRRIFQRSGIKACGGRPCVRQRPYDALYLLVELVVTFCLQFDSVCHWVCLLTKTLCYWNVDTDTTSIFWQHTWNDSSCWIFKWSL